MKHTFVKVFFFCLIANFSYSEELSVVQDRQQYPRIPSLEFGVTSMVVDFAFPAFDLDIVLPFYVKGINSLAFKNSWFLYIRGNSMYKPIFTQFGPLFELQYRIIAKNGFLFTVETGIGLIGEFFTEKVYSINKGFYNHSGIPYGIFSVATRIGGDCMPRFGVPLKIALMIGYRIQFPYNLTYNEYWITGLSVGYAFDLRKKK